MAKERKKLENPFVYEGYEGPEYFCDRTEETETVMADMRNGRNLTLVSPRKIGKTGLIHHVFHHIKSQQKDAVCIYVDIFHTTNQHDFVQTLGRAIVNERLSDSRSTMEKVLGFFSSWRPTVSIDPLTGAPTVSVNIERNVSEPTLKSIFDYLQNCGKEVYVAIDEFQVIADYPEKGTEALLRSYIQFMHNVHFIFSGSRQHLMYEIFFSAKRPFYNSTTMMSLEPLHEEIYYAFVSRLFQEKKSSFAAEVFHGLYELFEGHTWYMQTVLNRLYDNRRPVTDFRQVREAIDDVLKRKRDFYDSLQIFLTDNQFDLLKAIARERCVEQPLSGDFIIKYQLGSASSVKRALQVLTEKDLVYHGKRGYVVYDKFADLWLRRMFGNC